ncbi:MAG: hypothetical protein ABIJ56_02795 [Pseudomonadota bacterium]
MKEKKIKHVGALLMSAGLCVCLSMCAKIDDPAFDTVAEHPTYDLPYDPSADFVPDIPVDTPYDVPVDSGSCTESPCCLYPNGGCGAGLKCSLDQETTARACLPAGTGTKGSTCLSDEECAAGYICLGTNDAGTTAACYPYCAADANCPGDGSICFPLSAGGTPVPGANCCSYDCNLVSSSGCPAGYGCDLYAWDRDSDTVPEVTFTDCNGDVGYGTQDSSCFAEADCAAGLACFGETMCLAWCYSPGGMSTCTGGTTCTAFDTPAVVGSQEVGYCY